MPFPFRINKACGLLAIIVAVLAFRALAEETSCYWHPDPYIEARIVQAPAPESTVSIAKPVTFAVDGCDWDSWVCPIDEDPFSTISLYTESLYYTWVVSWFGTDYNSFGTPLKEWTFTGSRVDITFDELGLWLVKPFAGNLGHPGTPEENRYDAPYWQLLPNPWYTSRGNYWNEFRVFVAPYDPFLEPTYWVSDLQSSPGRPRPWDINSSHDGDPVNLANGEEDLTLGPDITAYNPNGPNASFQVSYHSGLATADRHSQGLSAGWVHNYETIIRTIGNDLYIIYPNGTFDRIYTQNAFSRPSGSPFTVSGTLGGDITITWSNRTRWVFGCESQTGVYRFEHIRNNVGQSIDVKWETAVGSRIQKRIKSVTDSTTGLPLLVFSYNPDSGSTEPGVLLSVTDPGVRTTNGPSAPARTVTYAHEYNQGLNARVLRRISQINNSNSFRLEFDYSARTTNLGEAPYYLSEVKFAPDSTNEVTTHIEYDSAADPVTNVHKVLWTQTGTNKRKYTYIGEGAYAVPGTTYTMAAGPYKTEVQASQIVNGTEVPQRRYIQKSTPTSRYSAGRFEDGRESTITYGSTNSHDYCRPIAVRDYNGRTTSYTWNTYGNLTSVTWPSNAPSGSTKVQAVYNYPTGFPNLSDITIWAGDANNATPRKTATKYHFDSLGRVSGIDRPVPGNDTGLSAWVQTTFGYDNTLGNLTTITAPVPNDTGSTVMATLSYTDANHPTAAKGQPLSISVPKGDGQNLVGTFEWNADGTLLAVKDALGHRTAFTYDASRRLEAVTHPVTEAGKTLGAEVRYSRAFTGGPVNLAEVFSEGTSTSQPRLMDIALGYDAAGELNQVSGDTEPWTSTYDAEYRMLYLADAKGQAGGYQTDYAYSFSDTSVGASITYPGNAVQGGSYDTLAATENHTVGTAPYNSVVTVTDGRGTTKTLRYTGPFGELVDVEYANPGIPNASDDNLHYDYDMYGRITRVRHGVSDTTYQDITTFTYDDRDNVRTATTSYSGGPTKTITYAYYPDGSRKTMDVQGVGTFTYTYNLIGQMTGLTNPHGQSFAWAYDARGLLSNQYQGGLTGYDTAYTYDARGRLASSQMTHGGGVYTNLPAFTALRYDAANNLTHYRYEYLSANNPPPIDPIVEGAGTDGAQAEGILEPPPSSYGYVDYTYEGGEFSPGKPKPYGLLYREVRTGPTTYDRSYDYDEAYNPTRFRNQTIPTTYNRDNQRSDIGYDGNGNPTNHVFDVEDRLVQYNGISPTMTFRYNGFGLRAWKAYTNNLPAKRYFFYDGTVPIFECYANGGTPTLYTYGANGLVATSSSSSSYAYYGFDPSGNRAVSMDGGGTGDNRVVDAFGQCDTGTFVFGFAGQWGGYTDTSTGLVLMGWRYYDPSTGRFLTRDPIGYAGGINLYAYCRNNPVNRVDPLGLIAYENDPDYQDIFDRSYDGPDAWVINGIGGIRNVHKVGDVVPDLADALAGLGSGVCATTDLVAGVAGTSVRGAAAGAREAEQAVVQANRVTGLEAEVRAAAKLTEEGYQILGTHVGARLPDGSLRVIDILAESPAGDLIAFEIKSGNATYGGQQALRDAVMATDGVRLVGKNVPRKWKGGIIPVPTILRRF